MRLIPVDDHASLSPGEYAALEASVQRLRTLSDVLSWAAKQVPSRSVAEIITQDEYTHDVVLEASGQAYLAFDTT